MILDIKQVLEKINNGKARIVENNNENIIVGIKKYDLEQAQEGVLVELPEEITTYPKKELNDAVVSLQEQIDNIGEFLTLE